MRFGVNIVGDIVRLMEAEVKAGEKAVTTAMRDAGAGLKTAWRAQIRDEQKPALGQFRLLDYQLLAIGFLTIGAHERIAGQGAPGAVRPCVWRW